MDEILIANDVIDWWKSKGKQGIVFKIDLEKAYDGVNWKFLIDMLRKMGCGESWCKWIKEYTETVSCLF